MSILGLLSTLSNLSDVTTDFRRCYELYYVTRELTPLLLDHPRFAKLQIDREDLEGLLATSDPVLYRDFITGIFDLYGNKHGIDLVGDKPHAMCALSSPCTILASRKTRPHPPRR